MRNNLENLMKEFETIFGGDYFPTYNNFRMRYTPINKLNSNDNINTPSTNVYEDEWVYKFEIITPGLTKDDLSIDINGERLTFKGERKTEKTEKGDYITKEYYYNKFKRSFDIPTNVASEEIYAKSENGITTIYLPKEKPTKTKSYKRKVSID
jgi:HSP20 family protein